MKKPTKALPRHTDKLERRAHPGMMLANIVLRPGCMTVLNAPSRIGNTLFHVDGTTSKVVA